MNHGTRQRLVLINENSRLGQAAMEGLVKTITEAGETPFVPKSPEHMQELLLEAKKRGYEEIWVGGGDGTIRNAACVLAETDIRLGILPFGTGNTVARELGIPTDPEAAVSFLLNDAAPRRIDLGRFNDQIFINSVSLGLSVTIAEELKNVDKTKLGQLAYFPATAKAITEAESLEMSCVTDDFEFKGRIVQFVAASTGRHAGPFPVTPNASIDDGLLSTYIVQVKEGIDILAYGVAMMLGSHTMMENVLSTECRRIKVELKHPTSFVLDGDFVTAQEADITIVPGGLTVLGQRLR